HGQHRQGEQGQGDVPVPPDPRPHLVLVQPAVPLASSNRSSIAQRAPATRTRSSNVVAGGPPQAKDATSAGSDTPRRISSHRAYSSGSGQLVRSAAQSYTRGPFAPAPQLTRCQASAGTSASNAFARTCRNPEKTATSARTPA